MVRSRLFKVAPQPGLVHTAGVNPHELHAGRDVVVVRFLHNLCRGKHNEFSIRLNNL